MELWAVGASPENATCPALAPAALCAHAAGNTLDLCLAVLVPGSLHVGEDVAMGKGVWEIGGQQS